jgi:hypothetical protein
VTDVALIAFAVIRDTERLRHFDGAADARTAHAFMNVAMRLAGVAVRPKNNANLILARSSTMAAGTRAALPAGKLVRGGQSRGDNEESDDGAHGGEG